MKPTQAVQPETSSSYLGSVRHQVISAVREPVGQAQAQATTPGTYR